MALGSEAPLLRGMRRGQLCRLGNRRDDHRAELIGSVTPRNQEQSGHLKTLT